MADVKEDAVANHKDCLKDVEEPLESDDGRQNHGVGSRLEMKVGNAEVLHQSKYSPHCYQSGADVEGHQGGFKLFAPDPMDAASPMENNRQADKTGNSEQLQE